MCILEQRLHIPFHQQIQHTKHPFHQEFQGANHYHHQFNRQKLAIPAHVKHNDQQYAPPPSQQQQQDSLS